QPELVGREVVVVPGVLGQVELWRVDHVPGRQDVVRRYAPGCKLPQDADPRGVEVAHHRSSQGLFGQPRSIQSAIRSMSFSWRNGPVAGRRPWVPSTGSKTVPFAPRSARMRFDSREFLTTSTFSGFPSASAIPGIAPSVNSL